MNMIYSIGTVFRGLTCGEIVPQNVGYLLTLYLLSRQQLILHSKRLVNILLKAV